MNDYAAWPWVKTGSSRNKDTKSKVWPCDLLIVMAKAGLIGNWSLLSSSGKVMSLGISGMRGMYTTFPARIRASARSFFL